MPYTFSPYHDAHIGAISELMQAPAQAQARAAEQIGNANANAALQSGQAWAGAAQNIGQAVGSIPAQMQQAQALQQHQKLVQAQIADAQAQVKEREALAAQRQRDAAGQAAGAQAIKGSVGPDGKVDYMKAADSWEAAGFPVAANAYRESIQKTQKTALELTEGQKKIEDGKRQVQQASINHFGELAAIGLDKLNVGDPLHARDTMMGLVANAASHGIVSEEDASKFLMQSAQAGPDQLKGLYQQLLDQAPAVKEQRLKDAKTTAEIAKLTAEAVPPKTSEAQLDSEAQQLLTKQNLGQPLTPTEAASLKAYQDRKRTVSDPAQIAATERQAATQAAAIGQQARTQNFQEAQVGRKELTEKVEQPYQTALGSAATLRDVVAAAKEGNKVAASLQSLETTMAAIRAQGLNRVNMAEIGLPANAGSIWDRLQARVGKLVSGQSVPEDLQKDMVAFADVLEKAAYKKYEAGFETVTKRYKLSDEKKLAPPTAAGASVEHWERGPDGKLRKVGG